MSLLSAPTRTTYMYNIRLFTKPVDAGSTLDAPRYDAMTRFPLVSDLSHIIHTDTTAVGLYCFTAYAW